MRPQTSIPAAKWRALNRAYDALLKERAEERRRVALQHAVDLARAGYLGLSRNVTPADVVAAGAAFEAFLAGKSPKKRRG
jgi:hypothetical protein